MTRMFTESVHGTVRVSAGHQPLKLRPVLDGTFQANPSYELLSFDRLPAEQQELFFSLKNDPVFFGVLRPRKDCQLPLKSACRDTALLFLTLQQPGKLPAFFQSAGEANTNQEIVQLVLDGVLEILDGDRFVHGPAAYHLVCEPQEQEGEIGEIARMSRDALIYAQALPFQDATVLSSRLYAYGRIPITTSWKKALPDEEAVRRCLRVEPGGKNGVRLARARWMELPRDPENDGWIFWQHTRTSGRRTESYKLYISPHPSHLAQGFDAIVSELESAGADAFKVGKDLSGILRPDKMVAYFSRFESLEETAARLLTRLKGCPAQGVPFTAQIDEPLISWGIDPPVQNDVPPWLSRQSWRLWVVNRLAVALLTARHNAQSRIEPWKFAIDRLGMEGVDTNTWTPLRKETD